MNRESEPEEGKLRAFADILKQAGYEDSYALVKREILPLAQTMRTSLVHAAWTYAKKDAETSTCSYKLWLALQNVDDEALDEKNVLTPHVPEETPPCVCSGTTAETPHEIQTASRLPA